MSKRNHTYARLADERGQSMVEFALIAILLFTMLFGIAEFGRAWFYSNHLTNSVRSAARYGAVLPADEVQTLRDNIRTYIRDEVGAMMDSSILTDDDITVRVINHDDGTDKVPSDPVERGDTIEVKVRYPFVFLTGTILGPFSGLKPITRTASMRYE